MIINSNIKLQPSYSVDRMSHIIGPCRCQVRNLRAKNGDNQSRMQIYSLHTKTLRMVSVVFARE